MASVAESVFFKREELKLNHCLSCKSAELAREEKSQGENRGETGRSFVNTG